MEYNEEIYVQFRDHQGSAVLEYCDETSLFTVRKLPSSSGAGITVGMMFGVLGQAVMNSVSTGKEVGSFFVGEISRMETEARKRKTVYTLYPADGTAPCVITLGKKSRFHQILQELFGTRTAMELPAAPAEQEVLAQSQPEGKTEISRQPGGTAAASTPGSLRSDTEQKTELSRQPEGKPVLLCLRSGPLAGRVYECMPGRTVLIGRDPGRCDLALPQYPNLSGVHCRLEIADGYLLVTDMHSQNGTYANGRRLPPGQTARAVPGLVLTLASEQCVFRICVE